MAERPEDFAFDKAGNERTNAQRDEAATEHTLATLMIRGADPTKYGPLIAGLANDFVKGRDDYPQDTAAAETMLELYVSPTPIGNRGPRPPRTTLATTGGDASTESTAATTLTQSTSTGAPTYHERVAASVAGDRKSVV